MGAILLFALGMGLSQLTAKPSNMTSPVKEAPATVIGKRQDTRGQYGDLYFTTFEFADGERIELALSGSEYGLLREGDQGILYYQGTKFKSFQRERVQR